MYTLCTRAGARRGGCDPESALNFVVKPLGRSRFGPLTECADVTCLVLGPDMDGHKRGLGAGRGGNGAFEYIPGGDAHAGQARSSKTWLASFEMVTDIRTFN